MLLTTIQQGASKADPFTIVIVANPSLESRYLSGNFIPDPILANPAAFASSVDYVTDSLFGRLPGQAETLLGDPTIAPHVRVVALIDRGSAPSAATALAAQDHGSRMLIGRRAVIGPYVLPHTGTADVVFVVSGSATHMFASSWYTSDDDARPGCPFTLDGIPMVHRFFNVIPGIAVLHATSRSITAVHEFQHAISSYSNGMLTDLYADQPRGVNKRTRPVPAAPPTFRTYQNGAVRLYDADPHRAPLGYPPAWTTYHCERHDPSKPAIMDDYHQAANPLACLNDQITRDFVIDRVKAKLAR